MRTRLTKWLALLMLMVGFAAHAQTWTAPMQIHSSPTVVSGNTCYDPWEYLVIDNGSLVGWQQAAVFSIWQVGLMRPHQPPPVLPPWSITLTTYWNTDLSIWVCQNIAGNQAYGCIDMDDFYGTYWRPEHVTVPSTWGWYYIIVTTNFAFQQPTCGSYNLTATQL